MVRDQNEAMNRLEIVRLLLPSGYKVVQEHDTLKEPEELPKKTQGWPL